jgi:hypothetical protein
LLARAHAQAAKYAGRYTMPAFAAYRAMDPAGRDELTMALAELSARLDAMRSLDSYVRVPVLDAFDVMVCLPPSIAVRPDGHGLRCGMPHGLAACRAGGSSSSGTDW